MHCAYRVSHTVFRVCGNRTTASWPLTMADCYASMLLDSYVFVTLLAIKRCILTCPYVLNKFNEVILRTAHLCGVRRTVSVISFCFCVFLATQQQ